MKRAIISLAVVSAALALGNPAWAERDLRNFAALGLGAAVPDHADFSDEYRMGFCGSLGYGTRLGRTSEFFAYGMLAYDQFRSRDKALRDDTYLASFNANARYYIGPVAKYEAGYVGLGPGLYWDGEGNTYLGINVAVGGDFPVGRDWSITADVDQHFVDKENAAAFLTVRVGAAYWFL
jgi:hypothetical protein